MHSPGMLLLSLLIAQAAPDPAALSLALRAVLDARGGVSQEVLVARVRALAEAGDASAAELLGEAHARGGFGVTRDQRQACDWYARAAGSQGDAAHNLALCFETGQGRPRDLPQARVHYRAAADFGFIQAKCALGNMLVDGRGGPTVANEGVGLCREAAEAGNANAQADYGAYLLIGTGTSKDTAAARRWLTAAATQGQANAAFLVGQIHWNGDSTPVDRAAAARWWKVAYDGGRKDAAMLLAREVFGRIAPDGEAALNRELMPEWTAWLRIAATEDPDAKVRATASNALKELGADRY